MSILLMIGMIILILGFVLGAIGAIGATVNIIKIDIKNKEFSMAILMMGVIPLLASLPVILGLGLMGVI